MSPTEAFSILGRTDLLTKVASDGTEDYEFADRNATFCSYVTAHVKHASADRLQTCAQHARFWGIENECQEAVTKLANYSAPALVDNDYALLQQSGGQTVRKYAAFDQQSTLTAGIAFEDNKHLYPLAWRKQAAVRLLERAERFGCNLPAYVESGLQKSAGFGFASKESTTNALISRLNMHKKAGAYPEVLTKLAEFLGHLAENEHLRYDREFVKSAMATMEAADAELGYTDIYGRGLALPEDLIDPSLTVSELQKIAGVSTGHVELINGQVVDTRCISKEALAAVSEDLAKLASEQLVEVLPTLPKPDADLLVRLL